MNILIVMGVLFDLAGAVLLTINAFTAKDNPAGNQFTFGKLAPLLLAIGFLLQLIAFAHV